MLDGFMLGMKSGDIIGHEIMGEVVEAGRENKALVADVAPVKIPNGLTDEQVLFLGDIFRRAGRRSCSATSSPPIRWPSE